MTASQDVSCIGGLKFVYRFKAAIPETIGQNFGGCVIRTFQFSRRVDGGKDLLKIYKSGSFQADVILGGSSAFVHFIGYGHTFSGRPPDAFDRHLRRAGYGPVQYLLVEKPCFQCPMRHARQCASA